MPYLNLPFLQEPAETAGICKEARERQLQCTAAGWGMAEWMRQEAVCFFRVKAKSLLRLDLKNADRGF